MCLPPKSTLQISDVTDTTRSLLLHIPRDKMVGFGYAQAEVLFALVAAEILSNQMPKDMSLSVTNIPNGPTSAGAPPDTIAEFLDSPKAQEVFSDYENTEGADWGSIYGKWRSQLANKDPALVENVWRGIASALIR
ncbi:hypothetical protein GOB86_13725 [Acetobacter lambici]|uniref:Uncharacterized protein n=1 Tax=Acetobacter lambici TaxID=1332824 RepID=A0ABT1F4X4_9PROT|nr:hypothetical protein [Acetobacter lambici]MCP1243951.1 hypothetical protein [Acetobacter lambici]MCP1260011.1 hypothetical protein [Acetobacter lambici]NHO58088.1 hypothetical protein [Acetobacter lambici]